MQARSGPALVVHTDNVCVAQGLTPIYAYMLVTSTRTIFVPLYTMNISIGALYHAAIARWEPEAAVHDAVQYRTSVNDFHTRHRHSFDSSL